MIRVVIVDDSASTRELLRHIISHAPDMEVVGDAGDGRAGIELVQRLRPDVVTMDINMPHMDGFDATRTIMETSPVPIVVVTSSSSPDEVSTSFRALEAGALTVIPKPYGPSHHTHSTDSSHLLETLRLMSEVPVVRRRRHLTAVPVEALPHPTRNKAVFIGASTGGPPVLQTIFRALQKPFPMPVLVVQHIAEGFLPGLVDWLATTCGMPVRIAVNGEVPSPGTVCFAPDNLRITVNADRQIELLPPDSQLIVPSVNDLFASAAEAYGPDAIGVLLTGMGKDGASALGRIRSRGGLTMAQDRESSIVFGMPGEAVRLNAAEVVGPPATIAARLNKVAAGLLQEVGVKYDG
jgi:two-component system chemotaxis response regulator CheB